MNIGRRGFLLAGTGALMLPAAAISDAKDRTSRRKRLDFNASIEDNLIKEYLQPTLLRLNVGAERPFSALHFSDTHVSMADPAELLTWTTKELNLYEARNNGVFGRGGFPFAVQSLAATIAYARKKGMIMLNTGDLFDFRSEMNIACIKRTFAGLNVFSSLGNHEGRGLHTSALNPRNRKEDDELRAKFEDAIGNPLVLASRIVNGVNFVAFDNTGLARYCRNEQFEMMEAEFARGLPVVLMSHMPPFTKELYGFECEYCRKRGKSLPEDNNLNEYYMMGENFAKSKASPTYRQMITFLKKQKTLKAWLCGHTHFEWQGIFGDGVPICIAGRNYNGECYEISFS